MPARHNFKEMPEEYSPIYTTTEAVDSFLGDPNGTCTTEEIRLAELDTDAVLIAVNTWQEDTGLKIDPDKLSNKQNTLLRRAMAEQIRYRRLLGPNAEEFLAVREYAEASGEGFSRKGRRPKYSDRAKDYLRRAGFFRVRRIGPSGMTLTWEEFKDLRFERW